EAEEAAAAATPAPAARRAPATPAAPPTDTRDRKAPSPELEEVLRRAVAASAAELEPRKPASAKRAAGPARTANVAETVRAALREQERLRDDLTKAAAPDRPRSRTMWLGLAALVVLAGTGVGAGLAQPRPRPLRARQERRLRRRARGPEQRAGAGTGDRGGDSAALGVRLDTAGAAQRRALSVRLSEVSRQRTCPERRSRPR